MAVGCESGHMPIYWLGAEREATRLHDDSSVGGRAVEWKPTSEAILRIDDRVEQLAQFLPPRWQCLAGLVVAHLHEVRAHLDIFEDELRRSLI